LPSTDSDCPRLMESWTHTLTPHPTLTLHIGRSWVASTFQASLIRLLNDDDGATAAAAADDDDDDDDVGDGDEGDEDDDDDGDGCQRPPGKSDQTPERR